MSEVEIAVNAAARYGQAPTWDSRTDTMLWVDPPSATVHRFSPGRGVDHTMSTPQPVGAAKPRSRGGLLLHLDDGIALFESNGHTRTWLAYWQRDGFHAGDTALDAHGQVWASTLPTHEDHSTTAHGWLARVTADGRATTALRDLPGARGLCFGTADDVLHFVDGTAGVNGTAGRIDRLSVDTASGAVRERRAMTQIAGRPGGICADADGCLWVAIRDAGRIDRYTPDGVLDRSILLPASRPVDCCFGGNRLTDLYITTAQVPTSEAGTANDGALLVLPDAGTGLRTPAFAG